MNKFLNILQDLQTLVSTNLQINNWRELRLRETSTDFSLKNKNKKNTNIIAS